MKIAPTLPGQAEPPSSPATSPEAPTENPSEFLNYILAKLREAFVQMGDDFFQMLPNLIIAVVLLFIGLIVARVVKSILTTIFKRVKLDSLFQKIGLADIFTKIGLKAGPSVFIPKVLYWLILLTVIRVAADAAGIQDISNLLNQIMAFLPKVLTASIILLIGFIVADLIQNASFRALDAIGVEYAGTVSKILFGFLFILILTVALAQLGIETELLNASVKIILGGISIALALALGLGLKTLAGHIVAGVYARDLYQIGTEIHIDDTPAKVAGVGPVTTKLTRNDGTFIIIPNSVLINEITRGRTAN
ncbi:MAG: hypothetical protein AAGC74_02395 [Verrucomicrobiota bacterium]